MFKSVTCRRQSGSADQAWWSSSVSWSWSDACPSPESENGCLTQLQQGSDCWQTATPRPHLLRWNLQRRVRGREVWDSQIEDSRLLPIPEQPGVTEDWSRALPGSAEETSAGGHTLSEKGRRKTRGENSWSYFPLTPILLEGMFLEYCSFYLDILVICLFGCQQTGLKKKHI